ncbi:response regulator [filamentous cyanobacterium LEGE 11480]|uniref:histidine kinase n=1 Tax=Romeriopsis navalis LEGE 11480 TaxID=2777977 RepID=A0A928Z466_9CYAN|nr:hybrid sensor histidine kinase/response regulator [Romeriopsis navalis]MBE9030722.1 response regulator [Romeriopsis navalis LEGE 11480]
MKNILVIEDEPQIRENLQEILTLCDFNASTAPNGLRGIEAVQTFMPDLILCDVNMPELDGHDVLRLLRTDEVTANIPFIFLTSNGARPDVRSGMEMGASDYLTKPVNPDELIKAINTQMAKRSIAERHSEEKLNQLRSNINLALPHELYTPLNGIIGSADLLIRENDDLDCNERLELAEQIRHSALRLYHLTRNFLLYAELEMMASSPDRHEIIRQNRRTRIAIANPITQRAQIQAKKSQRLADLHVEVEPIELAISEVKFIKLIDEVIDNAFKFSQAGQPVQVFGRTVGKTYQIDILDMGRGLTSQQIANLGGYMQFDRDRYEQQGGGLGLTIAKRLMELHGGKLTVNSIPDQETAIGLSFPL